MIQRAGFHGLYDKGASERVLKEAWLQVKQDGGSSGVDGKEIRDYGSVELVENLLEEIRQELNEWTYKSPPVLRVNIPKPDGSKRPLGIPTMFNTS